MDLTPKLSYERCIYLVQKCPELLSISQKSDFQSKLKNLQQLGLNSQLIYQLIMKHPYVLTCSEKSVKEKVSHVISTPVSHNMRVHVCVCAYVRVYMSVPHSNLSLFQVSPEDLLFVFFTQSLNILSELGGPIHVVTMLYYTTLYGITPDLLNIHNCSIGLIRIVLC